MEPTADLIWAQNQTPDDLLLKDPRNRPQEF